MAAPSASPRRVLLKAAAGFGAVAAIWAAGSVVDLHDGATWTEKGRHERGLRFTRVEVASNPATFKLILMIRAIMPTVLLGTIGGVCFLGAFGQRDSNI